MQFALADNIRSSGTSSLTTALKQSSAAQPARDFAALLARPGAGKAEDRKTQARAAAQQLVAGTFVLPILSKIREEAGKDKLFSGGQAEQAFGQQLDTILADRIVARANFPVVDSVYRRILGQRPATAASGKEQGRGVDTHG